MGFSPFNKGKREQNETDTQSHESEENGFRDRVLRFFRAEPQKEKVLRHEDFNAAGDVYYATVSARYKVLQRICCVLLVLFLLISIVTNYREITYGNLFYFFRDFGNAVDLASSGYETLSYDVYANQDFSLYRGGISAVSPTNVLVFTATGRRTLNSAATFSTPMTVCSDRYVLVYDLGGNSFAMYNSFSKVYNESFSDGTETLTDAAISDSGVLAVVTRSAAYKSVIRVYNKNIKLIGKYSKDLYSFDVAIDADGEHMAVLYYDVGNGLGETVVRLYDISTKDMDDEDRLLYETTLTEQFPLGCAFCADGSISVVTNRALQVLDDEGEIREQQAFEGEISAFCVNENGSAVAVSTGALHDRNRVVALNANGKQIFDDEVSTSVGEMAVQGRFVFLHGDTGVVRLDTQNGEEQLLTCQNGRMLVYDEATAIVCAPSNAVYLKFASDK